MSISVRAALSVDTAAPLEIAEVEMDEPRANEVRVRMIAAGVCHTDLRTRRLWPSERRPLVLGHEGSGVVEAVGERVSGIVPGDSVLLTFRSCRRCPQCLGGNVAYCREFRALNGAGTRPDGTTTMSRAGDPVYGSFFGQSSFATHAIAYADNVVVVDPSTPLSVLAPLGCGFQTGAGAVINVLDVRPGTSVVVFGAGSVGMSAVMAARALGAERVVAVDPILERRLLAVAVGATGAVDPTSQDVVSAVADLIGGSAQYAIETTAIPAVINEAIASLTPLGVACLVGIGAPSGSIDVGALVSGGKSLRGVIEGDALPQHLIPQLISMHARGEFPVEKIVRNYAFDEIDSAFADAESGKTIKPVLVF